MEMQGFREEREPEGERKAPVGTDRWRLLRVFARRD